MSANRALKISLGTAVLAALVSFTGPRDLLHPLSQVTTASLFLLAAISFLMILVSAVKWRMFLRQQGNTPSLVRLCNLYLVGYFVNLVMPSYVGGDVVRSMYVARTGGKHEAFSATFLERYTGLLAMVLMALIGACVSSSVTPQIRVIVFFVAIGLLAGSIFAFTDFFRRWLASIEQLEKLAGHFQRIQAALRSGVSNPTLLLKAAVLSLAFHALTVVNTVVVAYAIGWHDAPPLELCVVVPIILLVGAIPISPQGLGIQEGAFLYFLQTVGATGDQAMAVALLLRAKSYILALLGGIVWMGLKRAKRPNAEDPIITDVGTSRM